MRGERVDIRSGPSLNEVWVLEDARSDGDGRLAQLAKHPDPLVRRHALVALGRLPFPDFDEPVTDALLTGLRDPDPECRRAAVFALGLRGDERAGRTLLDYLSGGDPNHAGDSIEALSKLDTPELHEPLLMFLQDPRLEVRIATILATARWSPEAPNHSVVDKALMAALPPRDAGSVAHELRWRVLFALSRRKTRPAEALLFDSMLAEDPLERLYAARGLAHQDPSDPSAQAIAQLLETELTAGDWRVAVELCIALERMNSIAGESALVKALDSPSFHVRAAAAHALGSLSDGSTSSLAAVGRTLRDASPTVRNAAMVAFAHRASEEEAWNVIREAAKSDDAIHRLGAVQAAGALENQLSFELLERALDDDDAIVRTAAIPFLAEWGERARPVLRACLAHADNGVRLAAVVALEDMPDEADVEALVAAFDTTRGDIATEVAFHCLQALAKIDSDAARATLDRAISDPRYFVRKTAQAQLAEQMSAPPAIAPPNRPAPREHLELPIYAFNPVVEIRTTKGVMVFELFPEEAPLHVHNFLLLAQRGHFDGLRFHRVVSDFVIQGGDYRGDGNGAQPAFGQQLNHEIGPRRYVRGSLGMPRYEDIDSGGSQIFVTHRPTPHLDGRYTIFGELRSGGDVLDHVEVGDRILGVDLASQGAR